MTVERHLENRDSGSMLYVAAACVVIFLKAQRLDREETNPFALCQLFTLYFRRVKTFSFFLRYHPRLFPFVCGFDLSCPLLFQRFEKIFVKIRFSCMIPSGGPLFRISSRGTFTV